MARNSNKFRGFAFPRLPNFKLSPQLPLKIVFTVPFVLQTVGIAAVVGYLSYQNGQTSINKLAKDLQQEVDRRISNRLDAYLSIPPQINNINLDAYELNRLDFLDFQSTGKYFWRQLQIFNVSFINFATLKGEYIGAGDFGDGVRIEEVPLGTQAKSYQYTVDARGNRGRLFSKQAYNPLNEAWFANTLKARQPIWSDIYNWDGYPEIMSISANYPVYKNRNLVGVLGVDLKLSTINDFLGQLKIGKSGKAFIMERSGLLVASSVKEPPFLMVNGKAERLPAIRSRDGDIQKTAASLQRLLGNFNTLQQTYHSIIEIDGDRKYVQISPWRDKLGLDWLVVIAIPKSDFMAEIDANNQRTILLSAIAVFIAVALGIFTARWIATPILRLSEASQVLARSARSRSMGDTLDGAPATSNIRELTALSQSFHQMGQQLQVAFAELEAANRDLEEKVAERTSDLKEANAQIEELNAQLRADNSRMSAEIDIARRLQQMMLPNIEELASLNRLEVACFMEPAQEVGGDYYDVIEDDRGISIGIGDVTGHGLESGVLAIMAQTAVRTLLAAEGTDPAKYLNILNQVLYENARKLSSGKNMTFGLFHYRDGKLQICGQHEEVLVFRASGEVERIDTWELGMPLGMLPDIKDFVGNLQIDLEVGDGVVLYSDGIPEAEGAGRSLYGMERLIATVRQHWAKSAKEIQQLVIEDVRSHIGNLPIYDDITLVVLKQT